MNKSIRLNKLELFENISIPMFDYVEKNGNIKNIVRDKISCAEWKALIFGEYKKDGFSMRDNIIVEGTSKDSLVKGDEILIKDGARRVLGAGEIDSIEKSKDTYRIKLINLRVNIGHDNKDDIKELFKWENDKKTDKEKDVYLNGMYRMSYNSVYYYFKYFFYEKDKNRKSKNKYLIPSNKFSAYCSYLAIKEVLESKGYIVSQLDSFIKGSRWEYDALLLKDKDNIYERLFDRDDVIATIEIKTSGYYCESKKLISDKFEEYIKKEKIEGIPHIYIAINESESCRYYSKTYNVIKKLNNEALNDVYIPLFCKKQINTDYITIPEEYDLDKVLRGIKKK